MLEEEPVIGQWEAGGLVCCYGNHSLERGEVVCLRIRVTTETLPLEVCYNQKYLSGVLCTWT